jgi:superfamily II DNA or RNA helicase/HKD family nuclease
MAQDRRGTTPLPIGLYEELVTLGLDTALHSLPEGLRSELADLDPGEAPLYLARHLHQLLGQALRDLTRGDDHAPLAGPLDLCRDVLDALDAALPADLRRPGARPAAPGRLLLGVFPQGPGHTAPERPGIPLSQSALLVNDPGEPALGVEIRRELASADRVDLLCAFINYHGVRVLLEPLKALCARGGRLRVLTTTYMGATQRRALDELVRMGAHLRVSYETPPSRTRLHAKAWLFHRETGFSTALIGSSNLSHAALMEGLEWNVRVSRRDAWAILAKFEATFERYWMDDAFEPYDPQRDAKRLDQALGLAGGTAAEEERLDVFLDVHPYPHQKEILEQLEVERERRGKWRNLVVAATGTGKTIVAALDFKRLRSRFQDPSLLFVAHQERILQQSLRQFRNVLRDGSFGELYVAGRRPEEWRHVFASIQSLNAYGPEQIPPGHFDVVIVDEMHHAPAPTYARLLDHLRPKVLLGLTATPERADGRDVLRFFGGEISAELRLWDALDRSLLCPFQYFGVHDDVDLSALQWQRGGYVVSELEEAYTGSDGDARVAKVLAEVSRIVTDVRRMRGLGFCVSVRHAEFMAERFTRAGIPAEAVSGDTLLDLRHRAIQALKRGRLNVLFTVDLFNEGVDIPEVDTVLFLRPTESATVFLQQLGRGLRLHEGKPCLTVLDFIGQQHRKFRFDLRYRALTGHTRSALVQEIHHGFPRLPAGCHIQLDRVARDVVIRNLREALPNTRPRLTAELQSLGDVSLDRFLRETGLEPGDLYRGDRTFTDLRRSAGYLTPPPGPREAELSRAIQRLLHVDDEERSGFWNGLLHEQSPPDPEALIPRQRRMLLMLLLTLWPEQEVARGQEATAAASLWEHPALRAEIADLLEVLSRRAPVLPRPLEMERLRDVPLWVHCAYTRNEVLAAFGVDRPSTLREGVRYFEAEACDVFFITLRKSEQEYSPTTRYQDYVISPTEFHWESQSTTREASPTGQRYVEHRQRGSAVLLFVRVSKQQEGRTAPYVCLGPATYRSHRGERPMQITWSLMHPVPTVVYEAFKAAAG